VQYPIEQKGIGFLIVNDQDFAVKNARCTYHENRSSLFALSASVDTRKVGAIENRVLQFPGFKQCILASGLGDALRSASGEIENGGIADFFGMAAPINARISLEDRETEGTNYTSFYYTLILHK
jgi:hypothetical protein